MRRRPLFWLCLSVICFLAAAYFWHKGDQWAAERAAEKSRSTNQIQPPTNPQQPSKSTAEAGARLSVPGQLNYVSSTNSSLHPRTNFFAYRLSNTTASVNELTHNSRAILLENALVDTS